MMIQEVVGARVGRYFMPAYAGVAFSSNELRWSPRIRREDGLVRLVPGLGTRAVDRLADDYPVLLAPGQPGLRVNVTHDEVLRYAPRKIDLINLDTAPLRDHGHRARCVATAGATCRRPARSLSIVDLDGTAPPGRASTGTRTATRPSSPSTAWSSTTPFLPRMRALLRLLRERLGDAGGHRVRLGRPPPLSAAVPAAELRRRRRAGGDPERRAARARPVHREPLRLERPRARPDARRLRRSGPVSGARATSPSCATSGASSAS